MKRLVTALALLALLPAGAQAHGPRKGVYRTQSPTTFVPAVPQWSLWLRESKMPAPRATVQVETTAICGPSIAGCSLSPMQGYPGYAVYASTRESFLFEMGHVFDWTVLTNSDRRFLARKWDSAGWHWWDTEAGIEAGEKQGYGVEDGLQGMFAGLYQMCAEGQNTTQESYGYLMPDTLHVNVPSIFTGSFNTCAYIRHLAQHVH